MKKNLSENLNICKKFIYNEFFWLKEKKLRIKKFFNIEIPTLIHLLNENYNFHDINTQIVTEKKIYKFA